MLEQRTHPRTGSFFFVRQTASSPKLPWTLQLQLLNLRGAGIDICCQMTSLLSRAHMCAEAQVLSATVESSVIAAIGALDQLGHTIDRFTRSAIDVDAQSLHILSTQTALWNMLRLALRWLISS